MALLLACGMTVTLEAAAIDRDSMGQYSIRDRPVAMGAEYSENPVVQAVIVRIDRSDFAGARVAIETAMPKATPLDARVLAFQRERMRRIALDFDQDATQVRERLRKQISDITDAEFARWDGQGLLEHMDIDGKRLYFNRAASNLFRLSAEARARRRAAPTILR